jgi:replicative DNA helicase
MVTSPNQRKDLNKLEDNFVPIHDRDAERAVIGSLIRSNTMIDDVGQILQTQDFYIFAHQKIFEAIVKLHAEGQPVDAVTLTDRLKAANLMEDVGGFDYFVELYDTAPSSWNAIHYASIVREKAIFRDIYHLGRGILADGKQPQGSADFQITQLQDKVMELAERRAKYELISVAEASARAIDRIDERTLAGARVTILSGIQALDDLTGGFGNGELVIIAARTSQGKTAFALQLAFNACFGSQLPVLIFSMEQGYLEIGDRVNAIQTGIDSSKFRQAKQLTDYDLEMLKQTGRFFSDKPFYIDDRRGQTVRQIGPVARQFKRRHGLRLVVVDYLQLMKSHEAGGSWIPRHEEVAGISRDLKGLARELECPVVALAQLNREVEKRQDKKPQLSDLRESGSIEQDADTVLLLQPPTEEEIKEDPGKKDTLGIVVAKQRNGPTGSVVVLFDKATGRIENFSWDKVPAKPFSSVR